jgi:uncharacterized protein (TIGR02996 family)
VDLSAILADPDSDDARAVCADALVERGDPRGELIQLQLAAERDREDVTLIARADRLLADRGAQWFPEKVCVRRGFAEKLSAPQSALEALAAREPIVGFSCNPRPEPSPAVARLREIDVGQPYDAASLAVLREAAPKLRRVSIRVERLDAEVASAIEALQLDGMTLGMSEADDESLRRILVAPRHAIGVGTPGTRLASLGVKLRQPDVLLAGTMTARELEAVLGEARPTSLLFNASPEGIEWLAGWPGRASLERLRLREADPSTIEQLARVDKLSLRELALHGFWRRGRLGSPAAVGRARAFAELERLDITHVRLGKHSSACSRACCA